MGEGNGAFKCNTSGTSVFRPTKPVFYKGVSVELERGHKVIARISPVSTESTLKVKDLNRFFLELPSLGEDGEFFAKDLENIRKTIPLENSQWD